MHDDVSDDISTVVEQKGTNQMIFAYLDPGSGSLILQAVLGGVAGLGVAARAMRNRWRARAAGVTPDEAEQTDETIPADQQES